MPSSSLPSVAPARGRLALASIAGIGVNRPATSRPLARRVSGSEVTGVSYRVQQSSGVTTPSLAAGAARAALRAANADPSAVDLILVGTSSPDVLWPATACLVQTELQLPMVFALDLYAAQASFLTALNVASHYVRGGYKNVLLIGADCDKQLVDLAGQGLLVQARAAAAALLQPAGRSAGILATVSGGAARGKDGEDDELDLLGLVDGVETCLQRAGLALGDIDLVFGDQSAPELMRAWAKVVRIGPERLLLDPDRYGSLLAAAPFSMLHDAVRDGRLHEDMTLLLLECGSGAVWSVTCLRWSNTEVAEW